MYANVVAIALLWLSGVVVLMLDSVNEKKNQRKNICTKRCITLKSQPITSVDIDD